LCDFVFETLEALTSRVRVPVVRLRKGFDALQLDRHRLQFAFETEDRRPVIIELRKPLGLQFVQSHV
jgi:hypothetical protein